LEFTPFLSLTGGQTPLCHPIFAANERKSVAIDPPLRPFLIYLRPFADKSSL